MSIGSFNRTFVGTTAGTAQILFTVRNKTTLVEKSQSISINVNNSVFTFNATRTNTNQVVNSPVNVNFNLTQTGGTGDTYSLIFNTSSTGSFKYAGVTYTAGQAIPFVIGASVGEYLGAVSGNHDVTFTATNQLNLSKTATVSLNYINNDFTLSSSGDGTLFVNQTKDFNVFSSQLIPDASLTYQVKYSFDTGTTGNGIITNGGNPVALGTYQPLALGSNLLNFNASALGIVNLLIEVKNSNGLLKSTVVMFDVKSTEFTFTGGAQSNSINVDESTSLNFNITELVSSGTDYEISHSLASGSVKITNNGNIESPFQWYAVNTGSFSKNFTALQEGSNEVVFTVRNKITLQTKKITVTVAAYRKPTLTNILTGENNSAAFNCGGGDCSRTYAKFITFNSITNSGATLISVKITVGWSGVTDGPQEGTKTFLITNFTKGTFNGNPNGGQATYLGYINFHNFTTDFNNDYYFNNKAYTLEITDSNNVKNTITGKFTGSLTDGF